MRSAEEPPRPTEPFRQLLADMVLWLALVLLFLAFRVALFLIFRGELAEHPGSHAFLRCFETGLKSDATAATYEALPLPASLRQLESVAPGMGKAIQLAAAMPTS